MDLGEDWLRSGDGVENGVFSSRGRRPKRSTLDTIEDLDMLMMELGSASVGADALDIGDSFFMEYVIDFPMLDIVEKTPVEIEIFGVNGDSGVSGFHICDAHVTEVGSEIQSVGPEQYTDFKRGGITEKTALSWEGVHTNGYGSDDPDHEGTIKIGFSAFTYGGDIDGVLTDASNYYLTVGSVFRDEAYVFVTQFPFTTSLAPQTYDFRVDVAPAANTLNKGDSMLMSFGIVLTEPSFDFTFGAFLPLGYEDILHFGEMSFELGGSFIGCGSSDEDWTVKYARSSTGLTVVNATMTYNGLINWDAERDVNNDDNRILVKVPIHVFDTPAVTAGLTRILTFSLKAGESAVWTNTHEITIAGEREAPDEVKDVVITNSTLINVYDGLGVPAGDAAVFEVEVEAEPGFSNFTVEMKGDPSYGVTAMGCQVSFGGSMAYFAPSWAVTERTNDGDAFTYWEEVKNTENIESTKVKLRLVFATSPAATFSDISTISAWIGGIEVPSLTFTIDDSLDAADITVTQEAAFFYPFNYWITHGEAEVRMRVNAPSSGGVVDMNFLSAANEEALIQTHVCKVRILEVGENQPCFYLNQHPVEYEKMTAGSAFEDKAKMAIPQICPLKTEGAAAGSTEFTVSVYYELPPGFTTDTETDISSTLYNDDESKMWSVSTEYTVWEDTFWMENQVLSATNDGCYEDFLTAKDIPAAEDVVVANPSATAAACETLCIDGGYEAMSIDTADLANTCTCKKGPLENAVAAAATIESKAFCAEIPFFALYPIITTRGRSEQFDTNEGLFLQYIIKPQHMTRGDYQFVFNPAPLANQAPIEVCTIAISHVGQNFPCFSDIDNVRDTKFIKAFVPGACPGTATVDFKGMTNWGRRPIVPDLTMDDDAIQIRVAAKVCDGFSGTPVSDTIHASLIYMAIGESAVVNSVTADYDIELTEQEKDVTGDLKISGTAAISLIGPIDVIYRKSAKLYNLEVPVPPGYLGPITVRVENAKFDDPDAVPIWIDWFKVAKSGSNVPCVHPQTLSPVDSVDTDTFEG